MQPCHRVQIADLNGFGGYSPFKIIRTCHRGSVLKAVFRSAGMTVVQERDCAEPRRLRVDGQFDGALAPSLGSGNCVRVHGYCLVDYGDSHWITANWMLNTATERVNTITGRLNTAAVFAITELFARIRPLIRLLPLLNGSLLPLNRLTASLRHVHDRQPGRPVAKNWTYISTRYIFQL